MLWICKERGKSDGLAWHAFNDRYGHFPSGYPKTLKEPSFETEQWDKHRRIKWAKSKKREQVSA